MSEAVILASRDAVATARIGAPAVDWKHPYIKVTTGATTLGAVVQAIRPGPGTVELDPLLRRELNVAEGATVAVEPLPPIPAEEVVAAVPSSGVSEAELRRLCRMYLSSQALSTKQGHRTHSRQRREQQPPLLAKYCGIENRASTCSRPAMAKRLIANARQSTFTSWLVPGKPVVSGVFSCYRMSPLICANP